MSSEAELGRGQYMSLSKIIWEEKSKTAALNYMMWAIAEYRAGRRFGGAAGKPYVYHNSRTKMWEFWYTVQSAEWSSGKEWRTTELEAIQKAKEVTPAIADEPPAKKAKTTPKAKAKDAPNADKLSDQKPDKKKEIDQKLSKVKVLKIRLDGVVAAYHQIMESIETHPDGEWDFGPKRLGQLRDCKTAVDQVTKTNDFWKEWMSSSNFAALAKKSYQADDLLKYLKGSTAIESAVENLEQMISRLRTMRAADNK